MKLNKIFEPIKIKGLKIPNRIVFPPINTNYADNEGFVSERLIKFYKNIAKGNVGLTIIGATAIKSNGKVTSNIMRLDDDKYIPNLKQLLGIIKKSGSIPAIQLIHSGRQTSKEIIGSQPVAPSAIPCPIMQEIPKELSKQKIKELVNLFGDAAERSKKAGAEIIEIHCAHGYLINEFLSSYSNKRTDEYGGNLENRFRFLKEILKEIKGRLGIDYPICCRISAVEFVKNGLTIEDSKKIAELIENAGADLISISAGVYESMDKICPKKEDGKNVYQNLSKEIKNVVNIPVIAVGNILDLKDAKKILENDSADLVAMGRALIADPFLIIKTKNQRIQEINKCIQCRNCMYWTTGEPYMSCSVNKNL